MRHRPWQKLKIDEHAKDTQTPATIRKLLCLIFIPLATHCRSADTVGDYYFNAGKFALAISNYEKELPPSSKDSRDRMLFRLGLAYLLKSGPPPDITNSDSTGAEIIKNDFTKSDITKPDLQKARIILQRLVKKPDGPYFQQTRALLNLIDARLHEIEFVEHLEHRLSLAEKTQQRMQRELKEVNLKYQKKDAEGMSKQLQCEDEMRVLKTDLERRNALLIKQREKINECKKKLQEFKKIDMQRAP